MSERAGDRRPDSAVQYVYEEHSYAPLARVDSIGDVAEVYWYHAELNGLPERMTDADGETVWRGARGSIWIVRRGCTTTR